MNAPEVVTPCTQTGRNVPPVESTRSGGAAELSQVDEWGDITEYACCVHGHPSVNHRLVSVLLDLIHIRATSGVLLITPHYCRSLYMFASNIQSGLFLGL